MALHESTPVARDLTALKAEALRSQVIEHVARVLGGDPTTDENLQFLKKWADDMEGYRDAQNSVAKPSVTLREDLMNVIGGHSAENGSSTPDYILADYLMACLRAFDNAVNVRENWHGRSSKTCSGPFVPAPGRPNLYGELACEQHGVDCPAAKNLSPAASVSEKEPGR